MGEKNKKEKAKNKAKEKVAKKVGKKLGVKAVAALAAAVGMCCGGCLDPGDQPARSQTMNNDFRDCVIIANARTVSLDTKARTLEADADTASAPLELWTQTQANEGSETISPTSTPSMTIDTDAALDVPINKGNAGTSAAGGAAEKLLGAGADWVASKVGRAENRAGNRAGYRAKNGAAQDYGAAQDNGAAQDSACKGGECGAQGGCADGNCGAEPCADGSCAAKAE